MIGFLIFQKIKVVGMFRKIIFIIFCFFPFFSNASVNSYINCFTSNDQKGINLKFVTINDGGRDKWLGGYVKYEKSNYPITVVPIKESAEEFTEGRPYEYTTTWIEIINGKPEGKYITVRQGAIFSSFVYINTKSKKRYDFTQVFDAMNDGSCQWKKR
ncbi:hypothetical protein CE143_16785 [Photorhabdus luminescens]|uniref:Uncharacterized protein n=2 Tax=Morganellaceae TaxID=1903414 RepID=A0ABX8LWM0_9GAMM|nr:hypothetical protein [Photorhabdus akhurstii]MBS9434540.1 hypothetical protein [Photorhabdus hainanensis]QXF34633.1 hypothetical protein B0X70_16790 [Photorhabdus akhurstii]UJD76460.1 hypothetical protein CE143_16785 [Photorhabdus luminescens]